MYFVPLTVKRPLLHYSIPHSFSKLLTSRNFCQILHFLAAAFLKKQFCFKQLNCSPPSVKSAGFSRRRRTSPNGLRHTRSASPRDGPGSWCEEPPPGVAENHVLLAKDLWSCLRQDKKMKRHTILPRLWIQVRKHLNFPKKNHMSW